MKLFLTKTLVFLLVCLAQAQQKPVESSVLKQSTFSVEDRLYDLSTIWTEVKFSYAYYNKISETWDSLYQHFIPRVISAENDFEFYLELMRFAANIKDGHSGVYFPRSLSHTLGYPPLEIRKVNGRAVIFRLLNDSDELSNKEINPGLEIIQIDGKPVAEKIEYWRKLMCASTEQALDRLAFFRILTGPRNTPVEIILKGPDGNLRKVNLNRSEKYFGDTNLTPSKDFFTEETKDGIGYFQANIMRSPVDEEFGKYIEKHSEIEGLILDVRYNGGGSDYVSFNIISRLIDVPIKGTNGEAKTYRADLRARRNEQEVISWYNGPIEPSPNKRFTGWVVVLIGEQSHSATEGGLLSVIRNRPKTIFVGEKTAGSTGQPLVFRLSTGGVGAVCSKRSFAPDGSSFIGLGFEPDIHAALSQKDLFENRDSVLEKAYDILRQKTKSNN